MGSLFTKFLADSDQHLILDLDFFRHFFNYAEAYRQGMEKGDVDLVKIVFSMVEKMRQFDISPGKLLMRDREFLQNAPPICYTWPGLLSNTRPMWRRRRTVLTASVLR